MKYKIGFFITIFSLFFGVVGTNGYKNNYLFARTTRNGEIIQTRNLYEIPTNQMRPYFSFLKLNNI